MMAKTAIMVFHKVEAQNERITDELPTFLSSLSDKSGLRYLLH
jgi:hypothetical protein